jgi:flagellar hook-associated protein 3 FlgL
MTLRITSSMVSRNMLRDLSDAYGDMAATQRKLSTGKEITRPSDDPYGTGRAIALRGELEGLQQYQRAIDDARGWQDVTDAALGRMTDAVQRARELTVQAASDSASASARTAIADEIDQLVEAVKQEGNATYAGRYVFAGTSTQTKPYAAGASDGYAGDAGTIARGIGPGVAVPINVLGSDVLGSGATVADGKLLDVLRGVAAHLRGGTVADVDALRTTDLRGIDRNLDAVGGIRAAGGATANRLEAAASRIAQTDETVTGLLSSTEDADMAKAYVDFSMQQSVYQSALKSGAAVIQPSLLDFLR